MHSEHRFADLTDSLKNGFLADDIVLAIARAQRRLELSNKDRAAFGTAVQILEDAMEGHSWLDKPRLTSVSKPRATFFARAVQALPKIHTSAVFVQHISHLKDAAAQLANGHTDVATERLTELRAFFFNSGQVELERTEEFLKGENKTDALKWTVPDE